MIYSCWLFSLVIIIFQQPPNGMAQRQRRDSRTSLPQFNLADSLRIPSAAQPLSAGAGVRPPPMAGEVTAPRHGFAGCPKKFHPIGLLFYFSSQDSCTVTCPREITLFFRGGLTVWLSGGRTWRDSPDGEPRISGADSWAGAAPPVRWSRC
jgi:hypothetical protein